MANTRFVVFHTGPNTVEKYRPYMEVGRAALKKTNPKAHYVVLTDRETAPYLEKDFHVEVTAPSGMPLMLQFMEAQLAYEKVAKPGLVVLAGTDCVANRSFNGCLVHNMAITYRLGGGDRINNVAYIEDHDRASWFFRRAIGLIRDDELDWWGDQRSWERALGPFSTWTLLDSEGPQDGIRMASPKGRWIHLYPCRKYNHFVKSNGILSDVARKAYLLHYKGRRKENMVQSVRWHILGEGERPFKDSEKAKWDYLRSKLLSSPIYANPKAESD